MGRRLKATPEANVTRPKPAEVVVRNIAHPAVWKTALSVAGGKTDRVKVVKYGHVVVTLY